MKKIIIAVIVLVLIGAGIYFYMKSSSAPVTTPTPTPEQPVTPEPEVPVVDSTQTVIGNSEGKKQIIAYHFGEGEDEIVFIGGIHGGYEWNTSLVAYQAMDYLKANPSIVPENVKVTIIPVLNPDGLSKVTGKDGVFTPADVNPSQEVQVSGRFNANEVDLNRNFDCDWQANAVWQNKPVSGGSAAFSEPESQAIKSYVEAHNPIAAIVWYSSAGGVFASDCHQGVSKETKALTQTFAKASGYKAYESFDFYEITGDMVNWFAKNSIPAISVLLTNHTDTEWSKNKAGIDAVLKAYTK